MTNNEIVTMPTHPAFLSCQIKTVKTRAVKPKTNVQTFRMRMQG
jgi:hypothetical protein